MGVVAGGIAAVGARMPIPAPRHKLSKSGSALEFRRSRTGTAPLRLTLSPERCRLWRLDAAVIADKCMVYGVSRSYQ